MGDVRSGAGGDGSALDDYGDQLAASRMTVGQVVELIKLRDALRNENTDFRQRVHALEAEMARLVATGHGLRTVSLQRTSADGLAVTFPEEMAADTGPLIEHLVALLAGDRAERARLAAEAAELRRVVEGVNYLVIRGENGRAAAVSFNGAEWVVMEVKDTPQGQTFQMPGQFAASLAKALFVASHIAPTEWLPREPALPEGGGR